MVANEASDLHLVPGYPPTYRVHGALRPASAPALTGDLVRAMLEGVLPEHLTLGALEKRVREESLSEIIVATNPDFEGDGTALVLARRLRGTGVRVTRIARGLATGAKIEYANRAMLNDSLEGRTLMAPERS